MKNAFITGSTKGIGLQIAKDLILKDYFVYLNGHSELSIEQADKELNIFKFDLNGKKRYEIINKDLSSVPNAIELCDYFRLKDIQFDAIVFNLGITDRTPFEQVKLDKWNEVFETNLTAPFFMLQNLKDNINEGGKVIFISSISGCTTDSTSIAYGVSKGAIHVLVPYLAKEFANKKIAVNSIAPGYISTTWHQGKSKAQIKRIEAKHLAKRLGTVKEVSKGVLAVIDNDFINGQCIRVDGGFGIC